MYNPCKICGQPRKFGDRHQYKHSRYQRYFHYPSDKHTPNGADLTMLSLVDAGFSYAKIGEIFGVSRQRVGQRVLKTKNRMQA